MGPCVAERTYEQRATKSLPPSLAPRVGSERTVPPADRVPCQSRVSAPRPRQPRGTDSNRDRAGMPNKMTDAPMTNKLFLDSLTFSLALPACFWTSLAMPSAVAILTAADESFYTRARQHSTPPHNFATSAGLVSRLPDHCRTNTLACLLDYRTVFAEARDVRHAARLFVD